MNSGFAVNDSTVNIVLVLIFNWGKHPWWQVVWQCTLLWLVVINKTIVQQN